MKAATERQQKERKKQDKNKIAVGVLLGAEHKLYQGVLSCSFTIHI